MPTQASAALDPVALGAPAFVNFSARDGVPDSVIASVQSDRDGFVWLSSAEGLARFDGRRWNALDPPAISGALGDLTADRAGTLWVAFRDSGIAHYDGHQWIREDRAHGLPSAHVRRVVETVGPDGSLTLRAATFDAGLLRREQGHWVVDEQQAGLPKPVLSIAETSHVGGSHRLWAGTVDQGLWYREDDGHWQRLRIGDFNPTQVEDLLVSERNGREELWVSCFDSGLWRIDENGVHAWTHASGDLPSNETYNLAQSRAPDGSPLIWLATRAGLVRLIGDHADVFDRRYGLPSNAVRGVRVWRDRDGVDTLWVATENGAARAIIGANQWRTVSLLGADATGVFGVLPEADGHGGERVWVAATADGLGLWEDGRWRYFSQANGALPAADARMIKRALDPDGSQALWLSLRGGRLLRVLDGPRFEEVPTPWPADPAEAVTDVLARRVEGHYERWFALRLSGLWRWRDGQWRNIVPPGVRAPWRVTALVDQVDGQQHAWLWGSSVRGLVRVDGDNAVVLGRDAGMPGTGILGMRLYRDDHDHAILWAGTTLHGVLRVDVSDPAHPAVVSDPLPPPPDPTAYSALRDSQGRFYVCTNNGVQWLTPREGGGFDSRVFKRRDGMLHDECNTNAQFVDERDRFWTGTLGGLTVYDPHREHRDASAKPLVLMAVRVDGQRLDASRNGRIEVDASMHDLRVEFALLAGQRENESTFRSQLVGYEPAPGAWSGVDAREFGALPPGQYTLRIEARDYAGNPSDPLQLGVTVTPQWWQTRLAHATALIALLLGVWLLLQWRTSVLRTQRLRLAAQVAARTAELHTANARLLELSYRDALTGLANRRRLYEMLETMTSASGAAPVALILADVDHFKRFNDRFGHPAGDEALRRVAGAIRDCVPARAIVARHGGEEFACLLSATDLDEARLLAERMREAVAACAIPVPLESAAQYVTLSAGVASRRLASAADVQGLVRDADLALYQAKHDGRDCVRG